MGIFSNQMKNNESANFVFTNCNETVKTDWTALKSKVVEDGETKYVDAPMIPFKKFSKHAADIVDAEVIVGDYDSYIVKFTTFYGGSIKYAIHRDCDFQIGEHPKLDDIMVCILVKGEAAKYTAEAFSQKLFDEQNKAGNVCFKVIW